MMKIEKIPLKFVIGVLLTSVILIACDSPNDQRVSYESNDRGNVAHEKNDEKEEIYKDFTNFPVLIDSTDYLLYPVGLIKVADAEEDEYSLKRYDYGGEDLRIGNYSNDGFSGNLSNIKFQHKDSLKIVTLTQKKMRIERVTFLRDVYKNTGNTLLMYQVYDKDTNRDGKITLSDVACLYLSNLDGTAFRKLTKEMHHLNRYKFIEDLNRLYFYTLEDTNKDGEFDLKDKIHYYVVQLSNKNPVAVEYFP